MLSQIRDWALDPDVVHLNHGSFGAMPLTVRAEQDRWRRRIEANPSRFFRVEYQDAVDEAREVLAGFVDAHASSLVFVPNATTAINGVLSSLELRAGDEVIVTSHVYNAARNAVDHAAACADATVKTASWPLRTSGREAVDAVLARVSDRTRLVVAEHVTSPTAQVVPVAELVSELAAREVDVLIDGAHAPGMLDLNLEQLGAAYYVGCCHKWMCAPRGSAFLCARDDRRDGLHPPVVSHGYNDQSSRSQFHALFDWCGSDDPSAWLSVPSAIDTVGGSSPDGWSAVRARNHELAVEGREILADALGCEPPCRPELLGSMFALPLSDETGEPPPGPNRRQEQLFAEHEIVVSVMSWPAWPSQLLRVSAHAYTRRTDFERLSEALSSMEL